MKRYLAVAVILVSGLLSCSGLSLAQEREAELDYSWGIVKSISSDQMVIKEYDYDAGEDIDVAYIIDPNVDLQNVESLENIEVGSSVEIDYLIRDGERIVKAIIVEKQSQEEYAPIEY